MDPVTLILGGASLAGGIISAAGGRKAIDPNWLKQQFGAQAVNQEFIDLFNSLINSPMGQQMMTQAAEQGQQFANDIASKSAAAGMGPGGGMDTGANIFATSAAGGAVNSLQRGVKSDIAQMALPLAHQIVQDRMNAAVQSRMMQQQTPTPWQALGGAVGNAAGTALLAKQPATSPTTATPQLAPQPMAAQVAPPTSMLQPQQSFSRLGRGLSRFGARFGRFVSPPQPMTMGGMA